MKKILYITVLITFGNVFGQQTIFQNENAYNSLFGSSAMNREINQEKEAKGSQYFQEDFLYVFVDEMVKPFKMRYNAYFDEMEFDRDGVIYDLDKSQYKSIKFDGINKKYVIVDYMDGNQIKTGYLIELVGGSKYSLYKREKIEFVEGKKSGTGFGIDSPSEYKPKKEDFFMKLSDGSIVEIPTSKGKLADLFGEDAKTANKIMKENKVSYNNENDLKSLFIKMNSK